LPHLPESYFPRNRTRCNFCDDRCRYGDMTMIKIAGQTHPGCVRDHNEDAIWSDASRGLAVVADGMGGHAGGEVASRLAIEIFRAAPAQPLAEILLAAHRRIAECAQAQPECAGMGATAVAAQADARGYRISWVGDSRAYHWRRGTGLRQISRDHSYMEQLLSQGQISAQQARNHPRRNVVTQGLGLDQPQPENRRAPWRSGERLLLCSDGLSDELEDAQIDAIMAAHADPAAAVAALLDAALRSGGRDNISVIVLENTGPASPWRWPPPWPLTAAAAIGLASLLWYLLAR
jgi:protein phosphatase